MKRGAVRSGRYRPIVAGECFGKTAKALQGIRVIDSRTDMVWTRRERHFIVADGLAILATPAEAHRKVVGRLDIRRLSLQDLPKSVLGFDHPVGLEQARRLLESIRYSLRSEWL